MSLDRRSYSMGSGQTKPKLWLDQHGRSKSDSVDEQTKTNDGEKRSADCSASFETEEKRSASCETEVTLTSRNGKRKKGKDAVNEHRAIRTLGLIMGVFIGCWLPFFILNAILPWNPEFFLCLPGFNAVFKGVTWLGWSNSLFNPLIYACNKTFRTTLIGWWWKPRRPKKSQDLDVMSCHVMSLSLRSSNVQLNKVEK